MVTAEEFDAAVKQVIHDQVSDPKRDGMGKLLIQLASGISYKAPTGDIVNCEHDAIGNMAVAFVGTSGVQMGWLASQADMLADDWVFAE